MLVALWFSMLNLRPLVGSTGFIIAGIKLNIWKMIHESIKTEVMKMISIGITSLLCCMTRFLGMLLQKNLKLVIILLISWSKRKLSIYVNC